MYSIVLQTIFQEYLNKNHKINTIFVRPGFRPPGANATSFNLFFCFYICGKFLKWLFLMRQLWFFLIKKMFGKTILLFKNRTELSNLFAQKLLSLGVDNKLSCNYVLVIFLFLVIPSFVHNWWFYNAVQIVLDCLFHLQWQFHTF